MNTLFRHLLTGIFVLVSVYSAVNANAAPVFSLNFTLEPSLKVDQTFLDGSGVLREGTGSATNLVCGMNLALTNFLALYGNISIPSDIISSSTDENGYYTDDPSGNMDGDLIGQYGVSELSRDHNEYGIQIIPISGWVLGSSLNCTVAGNLGYQSVSYSGDDDTLVKYSGPVIGGFARIGIGGHLFSYAQMKYSPTCSGESFGNSMHDGSGKSLTLGMSYMFGHPTKTSLAPMFSIEWMTSHYEADYNYYGMFQEDVSGPSTKLTVVF